MKRIIKASEAPEISGVHIIDSRASIGSGFVDDKTWSGTKAQMLNKLAQICQEYYANAQDRFIIILAQSNIAHTTVKACTSSDDFYEAEEMTQDWLDVSTHAPAREWAMTNTYYASIVDSLRGREIFYDRVEGSSEEDN